MTISVVDLNAVASKLERPFALTPLAKVGDLSLSAYLCQGQMSWHKHLDEDELFFVHEGVVMLDTHRGKLSLHSEELAVVPKGVSHRSSSRLRSVVLLLRPSVLTERKNGHRAHTVDTDPPLEKVQLARALAAIREPYRPSTVGRVEEYDLQLVSAQAEGPTSVAPSFGALWLVVRGSLSLTVEGEAAHTLDAGNLVVVPSGELYRMHGAPGTLALTLGKASP